MQWCSSAVNEFFYCTFLPKGAQGAVKHDTLLHLLHLLHLGGFGREIKVIEVQ
jgi:hypothetical protein